MPLANFSEVPCHTNVDVMTYQQKTVYIHGYPDTTGRHVTKGQGQRASRVPSVSAPGAYAFCFLARQQKEQLMWAIVGMHCKVIHPILSLYPGGVSHT